MKFLFFIFFYFSNFNLFSQLDIESNFNNISTNNNQSLNIGYTIKKIRVSIGFDYNFRKKDYFPISTLFYKTSWPSNNLERIGFNINSSYNFFKNDKFSISTFLNFYYTKTTIRQKSYQIIGSLVENPTSDEDFIYQLQDNYVRPVIGIENNVGLECRFKLFNNLEYIQRIGGGLYIPIILDKHYILFGYDGWNLSRQFSFGLRYNFK